MSPFKNLKGKLSKDAYIAVLEAESDAFRSMLDTERQYHGAASLAMNVATIAMLHSTITNIVRADREKV